jgi:hypothetical protein
MVHLISKEPMGIMVNAEAPFSSRKIASHINMLAATAGGC